MNALKTRTAALVALAVGVVLFGLVVVTPVVAARRPVNRCGLSLNHLNSGSAHSNSTSTSPKITNRWSGTTPSSSRNSAPTPGRRSLATRRTPMSENQCTT